MRDFPVNVTNRPQTVDKRVEIHQPTTTENEFLRGVNRPGAILWRVGRRVRVRLTVHFVRERYTWGKMRQLVEEEGEEE